MLRILSSILLILALFSSYVEAQYDGKIFSKASVVNTVLEVPIYLDNARADEIINSPGEFSLETLGVDRPTLWLDIIFRNKNTTGLLAAVHLDGLIYGNLEYTVNRRSVPLPRFGINFQLATMLSQNQLKLKINGTEFPLQILHKGGIALPLVSKFYQEQPLVHGLVAKTYTTLYTIDSINYLKIRLYIRNESNSGNVIVARPHFINEMSISCNGPSPSYMGIKASDIKDIRYNGASNEFTLMRDQYFAPTQGAIYDIVLAGPNGTVEQYMSAYASFADEITSCPHRIQMINAGLFTPISGPYPSPKTIGQAEQFIRSFLNSIRDPGPFSSTGDTKIAATTGTPRNKLGTMWAKWLIQSEYSQIIPALEKFCLGQAARPMIRSLNDIPYQQKNALYAWDGLPHFSNSQSWNFWGIHPELPDAFGIGVPNPFEYQQYNGWSGWEYEHWHNSDIYVYYMLTGDKWAQEELESYATNLIFLLKFPPSPYYTRFVMAERSEGWTMIGARYIVMALDTRSISALQLETHMHDRINHIKNTLASFPQFGSDVLAQFGDARRWPNETWYSVPWQVGSLSLGFFFWDDNVTGAALIRKVKDFGLDFRGIPYQYYDLNRVLPGIPNADGLDVFIMPAVSYAHRLYPLEEFDILGDRIVGGGLPDSDSRNFLEFIFMIGK